MSEFQIAPSILSCDFAHLADEVEAVTLAGADLIHVDVMDGHFVPNLTLGPVIVESLKRFTKLPLDCHLMIEGPEKWVEAFAKAGATGLTIHIEATQDPAGVLKRIRDLGVRPGITLRPATAVEDVFPFLPLVDLILIMTVNPGFGGQKFMPEQAKKIAAVRAELNRIGRQALIEVDGGITPETAVHVRGADILVAGSAVFHAPDYKQAIANLKKAKHAETAQGNQP